MSELEEYRSKVRHWQNQVERCNGNIKYWLRRYRDVEEILNRFASVVESNVSDINRRLQKSNDSLNEGLGWPEKTALIDDKFSEKLENLIGNDSNLSAAEHALKRELSLINQTLADTREEMTRVNAQLKTAKTKLKDTEKALRNPR